VDLAGATFVGALPPQRSPVRAPSVDFAIFPFVYRIGAWPTFAPNYEVASVHTWALDRFVRGDGRGIFRYQRYGFDRELPCVDLDGLRIWGLTLRMVDDLVASLG
jgi:hypothetical protein